MSNKADATSDVLQIINGTVRVRTGKYCVLRETGITPLALPAALEIPRGYVGQFTGCTERFFEGLFIKDAVFPAGLSHLMIAVWNLRPYNRVLHEDAELGRIVVVKAFTPELVWVPPPAPEHVNTTPGASPVVPPLSPQGASYATPSSTDEEWQNHPASQDVPTPPLQPPAAPKPRARRATPVPTMGGIATRRRRLAPQTASSSPSLPRQTTHQATRQLTTQTRRSTAAHSSTGPHWRK